MFMVNKYLTIHLSNLNTQYKVVFAETQYNKKEIDPFLFEPTIKMSVIEEYPEAVYSFRQKQCVNE